MLCSKKVVTLLVNGWIRENIEKEEIMFEGNLSVLIAKFARMRDHFKYFDSDEISLTYDKTGIKRLNAGTHLCTAYGATGIPSTSGSRHSWTFEMGSFEQYIAIGIDETQHLRYRCGLYDARGGTKVYGIWSDGDTSRWDVKSLINDGCVGYKQNDIVIMTLDLNNKKILLKVNDGDEKIIFENIEVGEAIEYCMACSIFHGEDTVQLLDHQCD